MEGREREGNGKKWKEVKGKKAIQRKRKEGNGKKGKESMQKQRKERNGRGGKEMEQKKRKEMYEKRKENEK